MEPLPLLLSSSSEPRVNQYLDSSFQVASLSGSFPLAHKSLLAPATFRCSQGQWAVAHSPRCLITIKSSKTSNKRQLFWQFVAVLTAEIRNRDYLNPSRYSLLLFRILVRPPSLSAANKVRRNWRYPATLQILFPRYGYTEISTLKVPLTPNNPTPCHGSRIMGQRSLVRCHRSPPTCHMRGPGSQPGSTARLRLCHFQAAPRDTAPPPWQHGHLSCPLFAAATVGILLLTQSFRTLAVFAGSGVGALAAKRLGDYASGKAGLAPHSPPPPPRQPRRTPKHR